MPCARPREPWHGGGLLENILGGYLTNQTVGLKSVFFPVVNLSVQLFIGVLCCLVVSRIGILSVASSLVKALKSYRTKNIQKDIQKDIQEKN